MKDRKTSILVVDDEPLIRALLVTLFGEKFHCQAVATADAAMALLGSQFFHLVLTDIGLPGISGLELCRAIAEVRPRTVVVMLSGKIAPQAENEARAAGAFDFLSKPFDLVDVIATVERALAYQANPSKCNSAGGDF